MLTRLRHGEFALVAVGRALLSDPFWVEKIAHRRADELRPFAIDALQVLY